MTDPARQRALDAADPALKYLLEEQEMDVELQALLFHGGFTTLRLFAKLDTDEDKIRYMLDAELGLRASDDMRERVAISQVLLAWENAKTRVEQEQKLKEEAKVANRPIVMATGELESLRETWETGN